MVQLSHPHMTTRKTKALTRRTFDGKVTSLLFNMLSRFVIALLPRSKCLLILWLQLFSEECWGCEGDLVATSVTPLIARVDSADLAG